jgi:2-dehydropantoate 2-reductase
MENNFETASEPERIHILGVGNIGRLFAHALSKEQNRPPITLLLHRPNLLEEFEKMGRTIQITTNGVAERSDGYDAEVIPEGKFQDGPLIKNLIVPTKTIYTVDALSSVKHRLASQSTILFAQNGMGTMELVTEEVFPDVSNRPSYLACVMHHGVYSEGPFRSVHAGLADMTIGRGAQF